MWWNKLIGCRRFKHNWCSAKLELFLLAWHDNLVDHKHVLFTAKSTYYLKIINLSKHNPRSIFKTISKLTQSHSSQSGSFSANGFVKIFMQKLTQSMVIFKKAYQIIPTVLSMPLIILPNNKQHDCLPPRCVPKPPSLARSFSNLSRGWAALASAWRMLAPQLRKISYISYMCFLVVANQLLLPVLWDESWQSSWHVGKWKKNEGEELDVVGT